MYARLLRMVVRVYVLKGFLRMYARLLRMVVRVYVHVLMGQSPASCGTPTLGHLYPKRRWRRKSTTSGIPNGSLWLRRAALLGVQVIL